MNNNVRQRIGTQLRALREAKGLTTRELAERCDLTHSHIVRIESGYYGFSIDTLDKLTTALGATINIISYIPLDRFISEIKIVYQDLNCTDTECLEEAIAIAEREGQQVCLEELIPGQNYLIDGVLSYYGYIL